MVIFDSEAKYIENATSIRAKIAAIDLIISSLLTTAATSAADDNISEYWLNDGQTQIKTIYKGTHAIERSITKFERLRQMYINRLPGGRVVRLVDSKNFPNC